MPVNDPRAGRAFIWLIASLLFVSVALGGGCLIMYMVLPDSDASSWLPIAGVTLVCLPWLFWFLTFVYRIVSRVSGFRVGIGNDATTGGGVVDHRHGNTSNNNFNVGADDDDEINTCGDDHQPPLGSTGNVNPRAQVQFGAAATMMNEKDHHGHGHHGKLNGGKYSRSSSNSSNVSHESEMPLALSMAS